MTASLGCLVVAPAADTGAQAEADAAAQQLRDAWGGDIVVAPVVSDAATGSAAADRLRDADVAAVVAIARSGLVPGFRDALTGSRAPVVVWHRAERGEGARPGIAIASEDARAGGAAALAGLLAREGRPYRLMTGPAPTERGLDLLRAARVARALEGSALGVVGEPTEGSEVGLDASALEQGLGLRVTPLALDPSARLVPGARQPPGIEDVAAHERSRVLAGALEAAVASAGAGVVGGAVACPGAEICGSEAFGVTACLALNRLAERGLPFACLGDLGAAAALAIGAKLADAAQYAALGAPDDQVGGCLLASHGEGDLRWARPDPRPRLVPNPFFPGANGAGTGVEFVLRASDATLLGVTAVEGRLRLVVTEGRVLDDVPEHLPVPRGWFAFARRRATEGHERWLEAGGPRYLAVLAGRYAGSIQTLGDLRRIDVRRV